jgi:hypothetical protein
MEEWNALVSVRPAEIPVLRSSSVSSRQWLQPAPPEPGTMKEAIARPGQISGSQLHRNSVLH